MTVLSGKTIRRLGILTPHLPRSRHEETGTSFGESMAGYDIRLDQDVVLCSGRMSLASTIEKFDMPKNVIGIVHDKSSWARRGIFVQNTVIEPGWRGFLTLELTYNLPVNYVMLEDAERVLSGQTVPAMHCTYAYTRLKAGTPIAQVVFHYTDEETEGYGDGKYQDQERGPQSAR